jgi:MtrB/PioB family decaheme-associated outer membrane protein
MKTANRLVLLGAFSALSAAAAGAQNRPDTAGVDTSKWQCKLCKFEDGVSASVDVGVGTVSQKSSKFGDYTGLNDNGAYFIGDGTLRYKSADGTYWNVDAANLGLDSRSVDVEGGRQGQYKLLLNYSELPHYLTDSARSPFLGTGGGSLTLPAGFPRSPTTAGMPVAALQDVDIETKRKNLGVGGAWTPAGEWEYAVNLRHEQRDGTKRTAGSFFVNAAQLIEPVDYVTDQLDASAFYTSGKLQAKFAYYGSKFSNDNASLTWQNPFTAVNGESFGQLALAPDNQFHQVSASLGYQFTDHTRASADISWGRMTQDAGFLASTLNTGVLGTPALPRSSLDGRADTLNGSLRLTSAVTEQLRLNAAYIHDERDNKTSQATYPSVATDVFLGLPRTNLPYGFTQDKVKLSGDYRFTPLTAVAAGFDYDRHKRTFQEVDKTEENTVWGKISSRPVDNVDVSLKLAYAERDGSNYQPVSQIQPPENPLLRKFNMANRDRESARLRVDFAASDTVNLGFGFDYSNDDYTGSTVGLTDGRDRGLSADLSWMITAEASLHLFGNHQRIVSGQRGSATFSTPTWSADNRDSIDTIGIGVKYAVIKDKLDVGADYTYARSHSETNVNTGIPNSAFPELRTSVDSLKLYANYRLSEKLSLLTSYWYEHYDSDNWMIDGVTPTTIPNVLTYGEQTPRYNVHLIRAALRYKF